MNRRTRNKFTYYAFSLVLAVLFFTAGSRVLYADFKRVTTVTTTRVIPAPEPQSSTVRVEQPAVVTTQPAVTVEQPAATAVKVQPASATEVRVQPQPAVRVEQPAAQVTVEQPAAAVVTAPAAPKTVVRNNLAPETIDYDIEVKRIFASNENVKGDIIVRNPTGGLLSDAVHTRLYHNGKLVKEILTRLTGVPPGETRYSFDKFGIPQINTSAGAQGNWTMSIFTSDSKYSKDADFRIMGSTNSNNLQR